MFAYIPIIIGLIIYFYLPGWLQLLLMVLNVITPDPLPFLDEILMLVGWINRVKKVKSLFR